jgi:hypothetical protein
MWLPSFSTPNAKQASHFTSLIITLSVALSEKLAPKEEKDEKKRNVKTGLIF